MDFIYFYFFSSFGDFLYFTSSSTSKSYSVHVTEDNSHSLSLSLQSICVQIYSLSNIVQSTALPIDLCVFVLKLNIRLHLETCDLFFITT